MRDNLSAKTIIIVAVLLMTATRGPVSAQTQKIIVPIRVNIEFNQLSLGAIAGYRLRYCGRVSRSTPGDIYEAANIDATLRR